MPTLALSLLGPFLARYGEQTLSHLPVRSTQALLILLVVEGRPQQREQLVDLIWPGMPLSSGRKNLRQTLYELRRLFPEVEARGGGEPLPLFLADRQTITLTPEAAVFLDVDQFEALLLTNEREALAQAAELYRGDFLSDFFLPDSSTFEAWVANRRAAYRRQMLAALEKLAGWSLAAGEYAQALQQAQQALEMDDLRETAVCQMMRALAALERRAEALQLYNELRERLRDALDVEPAAETTALWQSIRRAAGQVADRPQVEKQAKRGDPSLKESARAGPEHNLPVAATPFIGREQELDQVEALLCAPDGRLVTLLGPGGIGKTRLALAAAGHLAHKGTFADGVWFVRLAGLDEVSQIVPAISAELPFDVQGRAVDPQRQLLDFLRDKKALLLLDNLEQLLGQSAPEPLQAILSTAPGITLLVTSRARLNLPGEQVIPLSGLALPEIKDLQEGLRQAQLPGLRQAQSAEPKQDQPASDSPPAHSPPATQPGFREAQPAEPQQAPPAVDLGEWGRRYDGLRLFEVSAQRIRPDFRLDAWNLEPVLRIARRVEGFPLGLEMAAAWIELLSPAEIAEQLQESFDLLEADWTTVSHRHHSARAVFEWSWRLLSEDERSLCAALSVFRSGFSREAGLAVGQASLKSLLGLSRKSWLQQSGSRFQVHELLRQYAAEKLAEDGDLKVEVQARHAYYFASYYGNLGQAVRSGEQRKTLEAIDVDFDNARMAWHWFLDQGQYKEIAGCLLPAMFVLASTLGSRYELLPLIQETRIRAYAQGAHKKFPVEMLALNTAEGMQGYDFYHSDLYGAETVSGKKVQRQAWTIVEEQPEGYTAGTWAVFAAAMYAWQEREKGRAVLIELVQIYESQGAQWSQAVALQQLGRRLSNRSTETDPQVLRLARAELVKSREYLEQALALFQILGDVIEQARTLGLIGIHVKSGDPAAAIPFFERAIALMVEANLPATLANYAYLAKCRLELGQFEEAFRIYAHMREYYERAGNRTSLAETMSVESLQSMRYGDLDHARKLRIKTTEMQLEQENDLFWIYSVYEQGEIERVAGNWELAREKYEQALALFEKQSESGEDPGHGGAFCHRGLGDIALAKGDYETAVSHFEQTLLLAYDPYEHRWLVALTFGMLGRALVGLGDLAAARAYLVKGCSLAMMGEIDWFDLLMAEFEGLVELFLAEGEQEKALVLAAFVRQHIATWKEVRLRLEKIMAALEGDLPAETFTFAQERGRRLSLEEALALAGLDNNQ